MPYLPYQGHYKQLKTSNSSAEEIDEYETMGLCLRLNITPEMMKEMSFVSLMNILISNVEDKDKPRKATQEDINRFKGIL